MQEHSDFIKDLKSGNLIIYFNLIKSIKFRGRN